MTNKIPDEFTIVDGPITYNSTQQTHKTLASYLTTAKEGTPVHRTYAIKAYEWLKLLKKHNINLQNINN
jgi:hypothetical protein